MHNSGDDNTNATIQQEASLGLSVCEDTRRVTEDERLDTDDSCTRYDTKNGPSGQNGPGGPAQTAEERFGRKMGPEGPPQTAGERLCQRRSIFGWHFSYWKSDIFGVCTMQAATRVKILKKKLQTDANS